MKKSVLFLFVTLIISLTFAEGTSAQNLKHLPLLKEKHSILLIDTTPVKLHEKSPFLAGSLSFLLPGLAAGQFYNEEYVKFGAHVLVSALCIAFFAPSIDMGGGGNHSTAATLFIGIYLFNWVLSTVDAVASEINRFNLRFGFDRNKHFNLNLNRVF
jgi:TM2 domain-containing membrane protein YozV